jgi:hypothetical protein
MAEQRKFKREPPDVVPQVSPNRERCAHRQGSHLRPAARVRHQARVRQSRLDRTDVPEQLAQRLGAAEAHHQLEDLQRVQEFEYGSLAANDVDENVEPAPVQCLANRRPAGEAQ